MLQTSNGSTDVLGASSVENYVLKAGADGVAPTWAEKVEKAKLADDLSSGETTSFPRVVYQSAGDTTAFLAKGTNGEYLRLDSSGNLDWHTPSGTGISEVTVTQYAEGTTARTCSDPIYVTDDYKIGIGSTSNAYGRKYVQTTEPSGDLCAGDIWYDTSGAGSPETSGNITIGAGTDLNKIITINGKQLILESTTGTVKVNGNLDANIPFDVDAETGTYTLVAADAGKFKTVTGDITIPDSVFGEGDSITIYNNTANQIDILPSSVTLRLAGSTITGARSLVGYGLATVICVQTTGTDEFVLVGAGLT